MIQRKFKCVGCGSERPCEITFHQEDHTIYDELLDDLPCILYTYVEQESPCKWKELKTKN